ncbi:amidase [Sediminibacillus dalangtanensis]|uniref:Amidase n=1 Tax=Sediminibacillus dalangtanensis TaxID=2729421 RepID=A0ABX7VVU1_9BACI|nr:amidase [Sediminibacillus dalangtanensis]QTN01077.1 amidase [Sediminibacillus dalangtanensis]
MDTYNQYDAVGLAELVKQRQVKPQELLEHAFQRLEEVNPALNAVIRSRKDKVFKEAEQLDVDAQPFAGVPMALKDISQAMEGEPLTAGSRLLRDNIAKRDSNLVARLRKAGFLFIGQTNTPEFGLKNISEPELYGATKNPWNRNHSSGGSSGGSAAAVASGIVPVAGASDGGGSIRIPASFTGLFGLKPTRGRTPVGPGNGRQWQGASIDFALSRSVRDSAAMLDLLQTFQQEAAFHIPLYEGNYLKDMQKPLRKKYRVAYTTASPVGTPVSKEAETAVHKVARWLEEQGHEVEEMEAPIDGIRLMENYYIMNSGEISAMMAGMEKALDRKMTFDDMEIVSWVLYRAGQNVTAAEYSRSLAEWDTAAAAMADFHKRYDFYITPANAHPAPENGELTHTVEETEQLLKVESVNKRRQQEMVYEMFEPSLTYTPHTQLANLTGQPAMTVPVHLSDSGLPMGVQFIAPKGWEVLLLQIAGQLEKTDFWLDTEAAAINRK